MSLLKRIIFSFIIMLLSYVRIMAIDYVSYPVNLRGGVTSTDIRTMAQDDKGYIWFGSTYGLVRYDGIFFHTYLNTPTGNSSMLPDNHIRDLIYWKEGLLIVRVQGLLCVLFDTHSNRFVNFPVSEELCREYDHIQLDRSRRLWLFDAKGSGLSIECRGRNFNIKHYRRQNSVPQVVRHNVFDNEGNVMSLVDNEFLKYKDCKTRREYVFRIFQKSPFATPYALRYKVLTVGDNIWVSTYGSGITVYSKSTGETTHINKSTGGALQTNFIVSIFADRQGNVWAMQDMYGVVCICPDKKKQTLLNLLANTNDEQGNFVKALCRMRGGNFIATNNSGMQFSITPQLKVSPGKSLANDAVLSMLQLSTGELVMGTRSHGVCIDGQWYGHDDANPYSPSSNKIIDIAEDLEGRIWMAMQDGNLDVAVRNGSKYIFRHVLPHGNYRTVAIDHKGNVWAGSETMLFNLNPRQVLLNPLAYMTYNVSGTKSQVNDINHIMEDEQMRLWVGTMGKGAFWADNSGTKLGEFHSLNKANGLVNDMVSAFAQDNYGHIWIATQQGMTVVDMQTGDKCNVFAGSNTGSDMYTDRSVCRLADGRLVFGTISGLVVYTPQKSIFQIEKKGRKTVNTLTLTDILVNGISILDDWKSDIFDRFLDRGRLQLAYDENSLTFRFSDFNYDALYKTRYQYKLQGYDDEWSAMTTEGAAAYRDLPYGKYTFVVKAFRDNSDAPEEYSVDVVISPPWWLSWWAIAVYILFGSGAAVFAYCQLHTVYMLRQRIALEKKMTEFKLRFFTDISHEFRTPLTIIHSCVERLTRSDRLPGDLKQPISAIARNEQRMMRLINQLLEFRKMENGKLRLALQQTDIVAFLRNIYNGFIDVAENKHINFVFSPQTKALLGFVDRGHIDKIAYNLIGNALKYTPSDGDITLRVWTDGQQRRLLFSVTDSGVGVPKEKQKELFERFSQSQFTGNSMGIGLNLTRELVRIHKGDITFAENSPHGSIFTVSLPLDREAYAPTDFLAPQTPLAHDAAGAGDVVKAVATDYKELQALPYNDRRVLLVEDDADVLEYVAGLLSKYFIVERCSSGDEALGMMAGRSGDFSLVVTDAMMPGVNGYELVRRMKADAGWKTVPVVMLTAVSSDDNRAKSLDLGVDAFVGKPFDNKMLVSTCCNLIGRYDELRRSFAKEAKPLAMPVVIKEEKDKKFVEIFQLWLDEHLQNPALNVDTMAEAMRLGRTVFYDRVKTLVGMTPNEYLKKRRMEVAAQMLASGNANISEVAYKVGFSDPHYFSQAFKRYYGVTPRKYQQGE